MRLVMASVYASLALLCLPLSLTAWVLGDKFPAASEWLRVPLYTSWTAAVIETQRFWMDRHVSRLAWAALRVDLYPTEQNYAEMEKARVELQVAKYAMIECILSYRPGWIEESTRAALRGRNPRG